MIDPQLKQIIKVNQHNILIKRYLQYIDICTMKLYSISRTFARIKSIHKSSVLLEKYSKKIPALKDVDLKDLGTIQLRRKLSNLPLQNLLALESQLRLIDIGVVDFDACANSPHV